MENPSMFLNKINLEQVINNLLSAIVVLNRDTTIQLVNMMAQRLANKSSEECFGLRGGQMFNCIHASDVREGCGYGPDCQICNVRKTVETTFIERCNISYTEADLVIQHIGRRNLRIATTYLGDDDAVILSIEDITEIKILESERLEKSKILAAIETAGAVSHEMNQPLQVIRGYVDMMQMQVEDNKPINCSYIEILQKEITKLIDITKNLQNIRRFASKKYVGNTEIMDIEKSSIL